MAIIYPESCRNITAGAMRQLKQSGYTSASGGLFSVKTVRALVSSNAADYFRKTEPAGAFMEALEQTKQQITENTEAIQSSAARLVDTAKEANKQMADVTGKFRAGTEHLGVAVDKLMKMIGRSDFEKTVHLAESLASSLERLAVLQEKGLLDKVMKAMGTAR